MKILLSLVPLLLAIHPIQAAEPPAPASLAEKIAPYIDEHTFFVARVDLQALEIEKLLKSVKSAVGKNEKMFDEMISIVEKTRKGFLNGGGREVVFIYGANDFPEVPVLLLPVIEKAESTDGIKLAKELHQKMTEVANLEIRKQDGFYFIGNEKAIDKIINRKSKTARPDIGNAWKSTGDSAVQLIFSPGSAARKNFEEISPNLPKEIGGGPIQTITRGMNFISFSISDAEKLKTRLAIDTKSPEDAKKIQDLIAQSINSITKEFPNQDPKTAAIEKEAFKILKELVSPKLEKNSLVIQWDGPTILEKIAKIASEVVPLENHTRNMNNLKQIVLGFHNYHDAMGRFPTNIVSKDGKPLLSWRIHLLPYLDEAALYEKFKLNEPWDSEHNKKLIPLIPKVYVSPLMSSDVKNKTTYLAPLGKNHIWDNPKGTRIQDITDGTSNTVLVIDSNDENAVIWTKPDDLTIDPKNPQKGLMGHSKDGFLCAFADGSVRFVNKSVPDMVLKALFTMSGGEVAEIPAK